MYHFGSYRRIVRTCITACALWLVLCGDTPAEEEKTTGETRIGVVDVERVLQNYWRVPRVKAELERYRFSERLRETQAEVARLEQELAGRRFRMFQRGRLAQQLERKRKELEAMVDEEGGRAREREKEAIEELLTDIRKAVEPAGRERQITVVFDSNTPQILFLNPHAGATIDVTDTVIENLNWR